jgi:hypothetical protein
MNGEYRPENPQPVHTLSTTRPTSASKAPSKPPFVLPLRHQGDGCLDGKATQKRKEKRGVLTPTAKNLGVGAGRARAAAV